MELLIIEAGRDSVDLVRFQKKGGELLFQGAERRSLEGPDAFSQALRERAPVEHGESRILLSLGAEHFYFRELKLPIADRRKQREVLPLELKGEIAVDVEKMIFDCLSLEEGRVMAIWASEADIEGKIASLREAGLEPQVVGASLFHWQNLVPEETGDAAIALSDGHSLAVYQGRRPILFRSLSDGDFQEEIARTLCLLQAGRDIQVKQVFFHGPVAASMPAARSDEIAFAPLPVAGRLGESFSGESTAVEHAGAWALATASLGKEPVNFRYGRLAYTAGRDRLKKKLRLTCILVTVFLLLLLVETGLRYYFVSRDLSSVNDSISGIYREVFPNRTKAVDEVAELKSEIRNMGGVTASQEILLALDGVAKAKNDDISAIYEAEVDDGQVRLKGEARSFDAVNSFKSRLAPLFSAAEMGEVKSRPAGGVTFTFQGTLKEEVK